MSAAPRDLHEMLAILAPHGWRKRVIPGLWRDAGSRAQFISPTGPGMVEVYGGGLRYEGTLLGALEYLKEKGLMR